MSEKPELTGRGWLRYVAWGLVLPVLYATSYPFLIALGIANGLVRPGDGDVTPMEDVLLTVYWPLQWLSDRHDWVSTILVAQEQFWSSLLH